MQREPFIWSKLPEDGCIHCKMQEKFMSSTCIFTHVPLWAYRGYNIIEYRHIHTQHVWHRYYESKIRTIGATMRKI